MTDLSPTYRSAAIKVCVNNYRSSANYGQLLGVQLAITDYASIKGTSPISQELIWLLGFGTTEPGSGITCETTVIDKTSGISSLTASADYQSVTTLSIQISGTQKITLNYGTASKSQTTSKSFSFSKYNFLMGLYGSENGRIESLGVIIYNSTICPYDGSKPSQGSSNVTNSTVISTKVNITNSNNTNSSSINSSSLNQNTTQ